MTRAVAYYRKSNDDKGELGESIAQQKDWAHQAAAREGVTLVQEFQDQSRSGLDSARPGFQRMIAFCEEQARLGNPIKVLFIWHSSRFGRADDWETVSYYLRLRTAGVQTMVTHARAFVFARREDRTALNLEQSWSNNKFSEDLSANTRRGMERMARKGLRPGGRPPYGYRLVDHKLVPDPARAEAVRFMFETYAAGAVSLKELGRELTARGWKSPSGKDRWIGQSVKQILENDAYLGRTVFGRRDKSRLIGTVRVPTDGRRTRKHDPETWTVVDAAHDPIVNQNLFDRVQAMLADNRKRTSPAKAAPYLLSGLLRCGHCRGAMVGRPKPSTRAGGKVVRLRCYGCRNFNAYGRASGCNNNQISADRIEAAVADVLAVLFQPEYLDAVKAEIRRQEGKPDAEARETALAARLADLERQAAEATRRMMIVDQTLFQEAQRVALELAAERDQARADLDTLRAASVGVEDLDERVAQIAAWFANLQEAFKAGDPAAAQALIRQLVERVDVYFSYEKRGKTGRTLSAFHSGLIYGRPDAWLWLPHLSVSGTRPRTGRSSSGCGCPTGSGSCPTPTRRTNG